MADAQVMISVQPACGVLDGLSVDASAAADIGGGEAGSERQSASVVAADATSCGERVTDCEVNNRDPISPAEEAISGSAEVASQSAAVATDGVGPLSSRKKKHRRGKSKKRRWKPYNKLTWEEKRRLEDRETRRAQRVRAERFSLGQPVAPYNTTQFLMEDHNVQEPDLEHFPVGGHRQHRESTGTLDSDEYYSSPEDEEEFQQKEFCEVYQTAHTELLSSLSKYELIQEYMMLEERVDRLEQKLRATIEARNEGRIPDAGQSSEMYANEEDREKARIIQQEMRKLAEENSKLRRENELLRATKCGGAQQSSYESYKADENVHEMDADPV